MRYVDRTTVNAPRYFGSEQARSYVEELMRYMGFDEQRRMQERPPVLDGAIRSEGVYSALNSLFRRKCAFCESVLPPTGRLAQRFRPPADAVPAKNARASHPYYVWFADCWENLYPICDGCRPEPTNDFPVRGERAGFVASGHIDTATGRYVGHAVAENALWLDPCADKEIERHLTFSPNGHAHALSRRGRETIAGFHLDRADLVKRRAKAFAPLLDVLVKLAAGRAKLIQESNDTSGIEYAGAWGLLLRDLGREVARARGERPPREAGAFVVFDSLRDTPGGQQVLKNAIDLLNRQSGRTVGGRNAKPPVVAAPKALKSVSVKDFKALANLTVNVPQVDGPPGLTHGTTNPVPSLLILGENAAGKSSILEAIALAMIEPSVRRTLKLKPSRYVLDPAFMGAEAAAKRSQAKVELSFAPGGNRALTITRKRFGRSEQMTGTPQVFAYGAYRHFLDSEQPPSSVETLFHSDTLLSNPEKWLISLSDPDFDMVVRTLRYILSIESDFEVLRRDKKKRRCLMVQTTEAAGRKSELCTPLSAVSSGYRAILAMACDILRGLMDRPDFGHLETTRALVLIDEVEAHLHPRWKMRIMRGLRQALPNVTFIVTTHDPLCLRGMNDGEVLVLQRVPVVDADGDTLPVQVESLVELPNVSELTVEQLLTSDLFSLFSTDDPEMERKLAEVADVLAKPPTANGLDNSQREVAEAFLRDLTLSLPIGSSDVHRLVQEAVVMYIAARRKQANKRRETLAGLRQKTRNKILRALRSV